MPGAFSPVFKTEPPPEVRFSYNDTFSNVFEEQLSQIVGSPRFREYCAANGIDVFDINRSFTAATLVSFAVQISKVHSDIGFGSSRLSHFEFPVLPDYVTTYVQQLGEFIGPDKRRFLLADHSATNRSFVRAALDVIDGFNIPNVLSRLWLPSAPDDGHTSHIVACRLAGFLKDRGFHLRVDDLEGFVFSGTVPPALSAILSSIPAAFRKSVVRLFEVYSSEDNFLALFSDDVGLMALTLLELKWEDPSVVHLRFDMRLKQDARYILSQWASVCYAMETVSGVAFTRPTTGQYLGSYSQACSVSGDGKSFEVKTHYSMDAGTRNYRVVFPPGLLFSDLPYRHTYLGTVPLRQCLSGLLHDNFG